MGGSHTGGFLRRAAPPAARCAPRLLRGWRGVHDCMRHGRALWLACPETKQVFLTPSHLCVVMEYVEGENLQQFLANTGGR